MIKNFYSRKEKTNGFYDYNYIVFTCISLL